MKNPLKEIEANLAMIDAKVEYLTKENDMLVKLSTDLRKITSSSVNEFYTASNNLLNDKRLANNTLINKLSSEKASKEQSLAKLAALFEQLSTLDDEPEEDDFSDSLPIMDISEELDDKGNVISSSVRPHSSDPASLTVESTNSKQKEAVDFKHQEPMFTNKNEEGLPYMDIKEELDANGNTVTSTLLPQVGGKEIESEYSSVNEVDHDQILELLGDMGVIDSNINDTATNEKSDQKKEKGLTEFERNLKSKLTRKEQPKEVKDVVKASVDTEVMADSPAIAPEDILQLELIADEFDEDDNDEEWDFEERENEDEDDDYDFEPIDNPINNFLMDQIQKLRIQNKPKVEEGDKLSKDDGNDSKKSILKSGNSIKTKKSVKFSANNLEQVKEIENVSEELKKINNNNLKTSLFKQARVSNKTTSDVESSRASPSADTADYEIVSATVKERLVVEEPKDVTNSLGRQSRFKQQHSYPGLMTPVNPIQEAIPKKESKFKQKLLNRSVSPVQTRSASENTTRISKKIPSFEKNLQSLNPKARRTVASRIQIPSISAGVDLEELHQNEKPLKKDEDDLRSIEVADATLDYQSLQDDLDGMAKAYVLGLYDDDIATEGEVIDKLEDFEKINSIIEQNGAKAKVVKKQEKDIEEVPEDAEEDGLDIIDKEIDEIEESDKSQILAEQIVEREIGDEQFVDKEMESIDAPLYLDENDDWSLSQQILGQQVSLQYNSLRTKLIANQNNFKKTEEEQEFEPIDENGDPIRVSRFKAARLVTRKNNI